MNRKGRRQRIMRDIIETIIAVVAVCAAVTVVIWWGLPAVG